MNDPIERQRRRQLLARERRLLTRGVRYVAGVDEAGRGPLAGPVVAAAVILPDRVWIPGIDDSKRLSPRKREELFCVIETCALSIGIGILDNKSIDVVNIREASFLAMKKAVLSLSPEPDYLLVDGNYFRSLESRRGGLITWETIIGGDAKCFSVAAASIVAKVIRDRLMNESHCQYPMYGFDRHKGYATEQHIKAIKRFGLCEIHRRSFHITALET